MNGEFSPQRSAAIVGEPDLDALIGDPRSRAVLLRVYGLGVTPVSESPSECADASDTLHDTDLACACEKEE